MLVGLQDEAGAFQREVDEAARRAREAEAAKSLPWKSEWTEELRDLLMGRNVAPTPLYLQGHISEPVSGEFSWERTSTVQYFGDVWLLRGWQNDEGSFTQIDVALKEDATLWKLPSHYDVSLSRLSDGRSAEQGNHTIFYPNVHPSHGKRFLRASGVGPAVKNPRDDATLRSLIGVPTAAAIQAGGADAQGWVTAAQSASIPGFRELTYSYYS